MPAVNRQPSTASFHLLLVACCLLLGFGCGYTARPGLAPQFKTVYIKPFINKIDVTRLSTGDERFPIYRHQMEVDITNAVLSRFQFTGLLRPTSPERATCRVEGELVDFRRDALRYDASQQVEEWRLNIVVNLRFYEKGNDVPLWEEGRFTGDTTYFVTGTNAETEPQALDRAIRDLARRIVERAVEAW